MTPPSLVAIFCASSSCQVHTDRLHARRCILAGLFALNRKAHEQAMAALILVEP